MPGARSAGEIDFTITGDTTKLKAQLQRDLNAAMAGVRHKIAGANFRDLDNSAKRALGSTNALSEAIPGIGSRIRALPLATVDALATGLAGAAVAAAGLGTAIATIGLKSASELQNTKLAIGSLDDQLKDISVEGTIREMRDLSIESGIGLGTITKMEQGFVSLGVSGAGSLAIIEAALSGAAASGNLTEKSVQGIGRALQQIGSKPFLQLEELSQIADQIPAASRVKIIQQLAKDTGDSIAEVQERLRLGTQQGGDALTATIKVIRDLDRDGQALERRLNTLGGAFAAFKQRATLALGDLFNEEGGIGSQLAGIFNGIDVEGLAQQIGRPVADALEAIVPPLVEALPDIVEGIAFGFKMLAPLIANAAEFAGEFAGFIVDHQDAIESAVSNIGDLFSGITEAMAEILPGMDPVVVQFGIMLEVAGALGQVIGWLAPVFEVAGKAAGMMFAPLVTGIDLALHGIEQLLEGVGLIPESIPFLGNVSRDASAAAAAIHNLRNEMFSLSNMAGGPGGVSMTGGNKLPPGALLRPKDPGFQLPKFPNTGAGRPDAGAKAAASAAERAAEALKTSLEQLFKDLNKYAKDTGRMTLSEIESSHTRIVEDMKEAIEKANEAGNKSVASALKIQLKRFNDGNKALVKLAKRRDAVIEKLDAAKDSLKALKDESEGFVTSVMDSVKALGNITQDTGGIRTTFLGMRRTLRGALSDTLRFNAAITQLRQLGLNETSLRQIVEAGPREGLDEALALARRGAGGVGEINALQGQLEAAGKDLATGLNNEFYAAGIRAAEGIVAGLQSQEAQLVAAMDRLADKLVTSIKRRLKIASPSGVFEDEVGAMLPEGAARGIYKRMKVAEQASARMAQQIINLGGVQVNGVEDPKAAQRSGLLAGSAIEDVLSRRTTRRVLSGEG